jgi:hypothetical protein
MRLRDKKQIEKGLTTQAIIRLIGGEVMPIGDTAPRFEEEN